MSRIVVFDIAFIALWTLYGWTVLLKIAWEIVRDLLS